MNLRNRPIDSPPRPHLAPMKDELLGCSGEFHDISEKTEMLEEGNNKRSRETLFGARFSSRVRSVYSSASCRRCISATVRRRGSLNGPELRFRRRLNQSRGRILSSG